MKREYEISGRLNKKIKNEYGDTFKPKNTKFYFFKGENEDDIDFEIEINGKRTPRLTAHNHKFETYSGQQAMLEVKGEYKYVNVNFENGEISPAFSGITGNLCVDSDGKVFRLEDDGKTTYSKYTQSPDKEAVSFLNQAVVVDENGKRGVIDEKFNVIIPFDYDQRITFMNLNFTNPSVEYAKTDNHTDFFFRGKKILSTPTKRSNYISEADKNLFYVFEDDDTRAFYKFEGESVNKVGTLKEDVIDAKIVDGNVMVVSKSGVWQLGSDSKKVYDCKAVDFFKNDNKYYVIFEENKNKGVYSLSEGKVVVKPQYDEIDKEYSSGKTGKFLVSKRVDNKSVWGVVNEQGTEVVPFEYTRPALTTLEMRKVNGRYEHALWVSKEEKGGKNKDYLLCAAADDVITERKAPVVYQSKDSGKDSQSQSKSSSHGKLKSEEEKFGIALGASVLFGSPIAGVIAMSMMNDEENSL